MIQVKKGVVGIAIDERGGATLGSRRAVERAAILAKTTGAHLELLHAAPWLAAHSPETPVTPRERREKERNVRHVLQELEEELQSQGVESSALVVPRAAVEALSRAACERSADLCIIGRCNDRAAGDSSPRRRMGSVARELIRSCPAPIWVVKPSFVSGGKNVLAATDLDPIGVDVLAWSHLFAQALSAELHVLHTWQRPFCSQWESRMADEDLLIQFQHDAELAVQRQVEDAEVRRGGTSLHVGCGSPIRALREGATELRPELLVLGSVSRAGLPGVVVGDTAQRVFDQIDCSLLVLKPSEVAARLAARDSVA